MSSAQGCRKLTGSPSTTLQCLTKEVRSLKAYGHQAEEKHVCIARLSNGFFLTEGKTRRTLADLLNMSCAWVNCAQKCAVVLLYTAYQNNYE